MKKILIILGTITLIGTSTTSLIACNTSQYTEEQLKEQKEKHKINIKDGILEWVAPQEKLFDTVDNKYFFVIWRGNKELDWKIIKFQNTKNIRLSGGFKFVLDYYGRVDDSNKINLVFDAEINNLRANDQIWTDNSINFKSVYRWNLDKDIPDLGVNNKTGKIKI